MRVVIIVVVMRMRIMIPISVIPEPYALPLTENFLKDMLFLVIVPVLSEKRCDICPADFDNDDSNNDDNDNENGT